MYVLLYPENYPRLSSLVVKFGSYIKGTALRNKKSSGFMMDGLSPSPASGTSRIKGLNKLISPALLVFSTL